MILGQLIQTGRRFCECRSNDFIPKSENTVVVIAYSIHDQFLAHSFDTCLYELQAEIKSWLTSSEAIGYLLIRRESHGSQNEFPSPIGRLPMDRITLTAATQSEFKLVSFYLEKIKGLDAYRLVPTSNSRTVPDEAVNNLLHLQGQGKESRQTEEHADFFEFAGSHSIHA